MSSEPTVITFGCRLNTYESEVIRKHAASAGLNDAIVVNTCAVTGEAVRQAMQAIRRLRRENPSARIIVTGCAAQVEPERFAELPEVDHVIGNAEKLEPAVYAAFSGPETERVMVDDIMSVTETAGHMLDGFGSRARAYVQIQNGCDHRCTFCIIPYGRGPSRSVPAGEVVGAIRRLAAAGHAEVVLTGVDITAYGRDLPGRLSLGGLVRKILHLVPELPRLRLSSIDQVEADDELFRAFAEEERLMPHLHLSLQAGDDLILKRMKRRHLRAQSIAFCERVRALRPDIVFGADIIAGFPTESEEMFARSLSIIEEAGLTHLHVFPFSPRKGTPAAKMPQVDRRVIKERAARLRAEGELALGRHLAGLQDCQLDVLVERDDLARTPGFDELEIERIPGEAPRPAGSLVRVEVTGNDGRRLRGRAVGQPPVSATAPARPAGEASSRCKQSVEVPA